MEKMKKVRSKDKILVETEESAGAAIWRSSVFGKIEQNSQENTRAGVSF